MRVCFKLDTFVREHEWHKAFLMKSSIRFELTRICSLNGFRLGMGIFMKVGPLFIIECVSLSLLYGSCTFDIWYVVCVCVCVCACIKSVSS